jgi:hypothetical protein
VRAKTVTATSKTIEIAAVVVWQVDVVLDDERRAAMVANLLVVPCSDQATQPIINTGSLYR